MSYKSWRGKLIAATLTSLATIISLSLAATALEIQITIPSEGQRTVAAMRDFYVVGKLVRSDDERPFNIRVDLYNVVAGSRKNLIRSIVSSVDESGVTPKYAIAWNLYGSPYSSADLVKSPPPDLVFDPSLPDSIYDPRNKVVVRENYFAALVLGGVSSFEEKRDHMIDYGISGVSGDLISGKYLIDVSAIGADSALLADASVDLTAGIVSRKVISRFSPPSHLVRVGELAASMDLRVYTDPFPGYWSVANMRDAMGLNESSSDLFFEIPLRWRPNNSIEYEAGEADVVLYNISESCASQRVEIGALARYDRLGTPGVRYWYYDVGEPILRVKNFIAPGREILMSGGQLGVEGNFIELLGPDWLALTRLEVMRHDEERGEDYAWRDSSIADKAVLLSGSSCDVRASTLDGLAGERIRIFGVVAPLQSGAVRSRDLGYDVSRRVRNVRVSLFLKRGDGDRIELLPSSTVPVALRRYYGAARTPSVSIYEFVSEFKIPEDVDIESHDELEIVAVQDLADAASLPSAD